MSHRKFCCLDVLLFNTFCEKQLIKQTDSIVLKNRRYLGLLQFSNHSTGLQIDLLVFHSLFHLPNVELHHFWKNVHSTVVQTDLHSVQIIVKLRNLVVATLCLKMHIKGSPVGGIAYLQLPKNALFDHFGHRLFKSEVFIHDGRVCTSVCLMEHCPTLCLVISLLNIDQLHCQPSQKEPHFLESIEREDALRIQRLKRP